MSSAGILTVIVWINFKCLVHVQAIIFETRDSNLYQPITLKHLMVQPDAIILAWNEMLFRQIIWLLMLHAGADWPCGFWVNSMLALIYQSTSGYMNEGKFKHTVSRLVQYSWVFSYEKRIWIWFYKFKLKCDKTISNSSHIFGNIQLFLCALSSSIF